MRIDILTLFPEMFHAVLGQSILKRAQDKGVVQYFIWNIRDFSQNKHKKVDDRPYGGGPGMVLKPEPIFAAIEEVEKQTSTTAKKILLTPQGTKFSQQIAYEFSKEAHLILICGHYEGFDERIREGLDVVEISIGDYVLSGGEIPTMVVIDAVVRLVPGVLGEAESPCDESFSNGLLEYPQFTRPADFRGMKVPEILVSGNHGNIKRWRIEQSLKRTQSRRPDLLKKG
ncbi:MAG: tRNA (guanosine(37)-N1)-methyltransferase TrmD [Candidatus Brocadiales bacterium]